MIEIGSGTLIAEDVLPMIRPEQSAIFSLRITKSLFAATAISGLAQGLQTTTVSPLTGAIISAGSLRNGLGQGAAAVADRYAQIILRTIERDGYFVRVPAGKQFYLYVTQTVDQGDARIGAQLKSAREREAGPKPAGCRVDRQAGWQLECRAAITWTGTGAGKDDNLIRCNFGFQAKRNLKKLDIALE
jgi:hypothetical protein